MNTRRRRPITLDKDQLYYEKVVARTPIMLEAARDRLGQVADLHLGQAEHLPFADKEFDFSVLLTVLEFCPDPGLALREAARVTRKAVLVAFLNRFSLHGQTLWARSRRKKGHTLDGARWFTPWTMRRLIREQLGVRCGGLFSILPGPRRTWSEAPPWRWLNDPILSWPVGAICSGTVSLTGRPVMPRTCAIPA